MNLKKAKDVAIFLLNQEMVKTDFPFLVIHPVFDSSFLMSITEKEIFNAFEDNEKYMEVVAFQEQRINECKEVEELFCIIRKSYILTFIQLMYEYEAVTEQEAGHLLIEQWDRIENIGTDANVRKSQIRKWLSCITENDMPDNERKRYESLSDVTTVYRGVRTNSNSAIKGFSWTISYDTAKFFANRFGDSGYIYKAEIKKEDVFFTDFSRGEQEYVVDYRKLMNITLCE